MKAYRQYKKTQGLAGRRNQLGFTQKIMAAHLGISRSMLCRIECANRNLPMHVHLKMLELEKLMDKQIAGINDMERKDDAGALQQATIQPQANTAASTEDNQAAIYRAQYELQQMTSRWNGLQQNMQQLNNLCDAGEKGVIQFSPVLLENQRCKLLEQMKRCDMTAQQAVRNKIAALENRFNEL